MPRPRTAERRFLKENQLRKIANYMEGLTPEVWGSRAKAGTRVTPASAMAFSAVFACVRVISESVGVLPAHLYRRTPEGKRVAAENPLDYLLHVAPNPCMDAAVFRETLMGHVLLWGNAYAEVEWGEDGRPAALWPLAPWLVKPDRSRATGEVYYRVSSPDQARGWAGGGPPPPAAVLPAHRVFHIMGYTDNGYEGKSVLSYVRESVGLGLAVEEFGARYFANGTNLGGMVEMPGKLSDQAYERLRAELDEKYKGLGRSHRVIILEEGAKFAKIAIPPNDSQMLETRRFQTEEIARFYRVPPHLIQSLERSTNNNIEHQGIDFVTHCIQPWVVKWEMAVQRQLLWGAERLTHFAKFNLASLLRGDAKSRYESYAIGRQWGWLSANDIRELEDLDRLPGGQGDMYLVPMNMVPADRVGDVLDAQIAGMGAAEGGGGGADGGAAGGSQGGAAGVIENGIDADGEDDLRRFIVVKKNELRAGYGNRATLAQIALANERKAIARAHDEVFAKAARRLLSIEGGAVGRALETVLGAQGPEMMSGWIKTYYDGRFKKDALSALSDPVTGSDAAVREYARALRDHLADELGNIEAGAKAMGDDQLDEFAGRYIQSFVDRYAYRSKKQLREAIYKATKDGGGRDDAALEVRKALTIMAAERPGKIAGDDATRMCGELTRAFAEGAGAKVRWVTTSGKPCPYCARMNGRVVGREGMYGDASNPRIGLRRSPPLHTGCRCTLVLQAPPGGLQLDRIDDRILSTRVSQPPMDPVKYHRMVKALKRQGGDVVQSPEIDRFLLALGAEAETTIDGRTIRLFRGRPSASAFFEEVIHSAQIRRYPDKEYYWSHNEEVRNEMEIEANEKLLRHADKYGLYQSEVDKIKKNLERHKQEKQERQRGD